MTERPVFLPPYHADAQRRRNGDTPPPAPELHVHITDETARVWPTALTLLLMALGTWKLIELVAHAV